MCSQGAPGLALRIAQVEAHGEREYGQAAGQQQWLGRLLGEIGRQHEQQANGRGDKGGYAGCYRYRHAEAPVVQCGCRSRHKPGDNDRKAAVVAETYAEVEAGVEGFRDRQKDRPGKDQKQYDAGQRHALSASEILGQKPARHGDDG